MADSQDHQDHDADYRAGDDQRPIWGSMRYVESTYGLSQSTQRNLSRLGKIEMVRLVGIGGGKLVRVNLPSVDRYFASLPKVEPGTGRWLGPERNRGHSPKRRRIKERHGDLIKGSKKPEPVSKGEIEEP
jgi:hypothetical protein